MKRSKSEPMKNEPTRKGAYTNKGRTAVHCTHYADHVCQKCIDKPEFKKLVATAPRTIQDQLAAAVSLTPAVVLVGKDAIAALQEGDFVCVSYFDEGKRSMGGQVVKKDADTLSIFGYMGNADAPIPVEVFAKERLLFDKVAGREVQVRLANSSETNTITNFKGKFLLPEAMRYPKGKLICLVYPPEVEAKGYEQ